MICVSIVDELKCEVDLNAAIKDILGYQFNNVSLLTEAFTHCSCQHQLNNQRLEFLGDAILDFAVVQLTFSKYAFVDEGNLNHLINNRFSVRAGKR